MKPFYCRKGATFLIICNPNLLQLTFCKYLTLLPPTGYLRVRGTLRHNIPMKNQWNEIQKKWNVKIKLPEVMC